MTFIVCNQHFSLLNFASIGVQEGFGDYFREKDNDFLIRAVNLVDVNEETVFSIQGYFVNGLEGCNKVKNNELPNETKGVKKVVDLIIYRHYEEDNI